VLLKALNDVIPGYRKHVETYTGLLKAGKHDEAVTLIMGELRKAQNEYLKAVNDIIHYQTELMEEAGKSADAAASQARTILIVLLLVAIALGVVLGIMITRSITRPVNACC